MAIEKFRFVSPGVQVNEIDDSIRQSTAPAIGPVIIGNAAKGPSMQPVQVSTISELDRIFGVPSNGTVGAQDVWRTGMPTSPTLATYAARAFLRNSFPITVVRLAGVPMDPSTQSGKPGWYADKVYHILAISGSESKLAANIYANSATIINLKNADANNAITGSLFELQITTSTTKDYPCTFIPADSNTFIRNMLVTNPSMYKTEGYFLGESYENSTIQNPTHFQLVTGSAAFKDFRNNDGATSAESAWIVGDVAHGSNENNANYTKLFRFRGLNNGSTLSKDIKISVENIKQSKNLQVTPYGTFDIVIRKLYETQQLSVIERFNDLTLDPDSSNFVVRRIGDSYRAWNNISQRYEEFGTYANRSAYIRIEMSGEDIEKNALPRGFVIKGMPNSSSFHGAFHDTTHPNISLKSEMRTSEAKSKRFGLLSDVVANADLVDILAQKPFNLATNEVSVDYLFHTRFVSQSTDAGTVSKIMYNGTTYYDKKDLFASGSFLGFDLPLYNGFEGKDITVREAFINNYDLSQGDPNENSNAAYRAIKQAIDIVSQPELIDMNLVAIPGLQKKELTQYLIDIAKSRGDCLAVIDLEGDYLYPYESQNGMQETRPTNVKSVVEALETRAIDNSYGAAYFPAVFVPTEAIFMPSSVAAIGAIGGTEGRSALWFAPAGFNRGGLTLGNSGISVSRTAFPLISSDRDALYQVNINPIATFPNEGVVIFGQKTLQTTPSALDRVNVRRLVNFLKKQISRIGTRILFEPNVENTWNRFKNIVDPFLESVKNAYGLEDALVLLNNATTTADLVDRNTMYCKIFIRPTRAIEYVAIDFVVTNSGALFSEG